MIAMSNTLDTRYRLHYFTHLMCSLRTTLFAGLISSGDFCKNTGQAEGCFPLVADKRI